MKVISLLQPWASACITPAIPDQLDGPAAKEWETRSWKPGEENKRIVQTEGLLIHVSKKLEKTQRELLATWPFNDYLRSPLILSAIIGYVHVGRIISTEQWLKEFDHLPWSHEQKKFGVYTPKRSAWHFPRFFAFPEPITNVAGSLQLWDCPDAILPQALEMIPQAMKLPTATKTPLYEKGLLPFTEQ